jgi:hypothetical protein
MRYENFIDDEKVQSILQEINENGIVANEIKFKKMIYDFFFHEQKIYNECNRVTVKYYDGRHYASALLYYCTMKGWVEPITILLYVGVDFLDICYIDYTCQPSKIPETVKHLFSEEMFAIWEEEKPY